MLIIGIDPGITGSICFFQDGKIVDVIDENKLVISCGIGCLLLEDYFITPELSKADEKIYFKIGNKLN